MRVISRLSRVLAVFTLTFVLSALTVGPAFAARGGGGSRGSGGTTTGSGSGLTLVLLNSTDGQAHWGQNVTFSISTSATTQPYVDLKCSQSGALVYSASAGFFAGYPWPWTQIMPLSSPSWTGGAANCTARLYYLSGSTTTTLSTLSFHAYA